MLNERTVRDFAGCGRAPGEQKIASLILFCWSTALGEQK